MTAPVDTPRTASAAASAAAAATALAVRERIMMFLSERGTHGATDEELQDSLAISGDSERPRRLELQASGLVRASGQTRATRRGKSATVWIARKPPRRALCRAPAPHRQEELPWPADLARWAMGLEARDIPERFSLKAGQIVTNSALFLANLKENLLAGPTGPRARLGVIQEEVQALWRLLAPCEQANDLPGGGAPGVGG